MNREIALLVTGAGGAGTIEIVRSLKKLQRYRIITLDASPYAAGFAFADRGYVVPPAVDPSFQQVLQRIMAEEKPDFVVPLIDEEIPITHQVVATLPDRRPLVVTPSLSFCLAALDKWQTFQTLSSVGIPTPPTWLANQAEGCAFPSVIKPRDGRGSREVGYLGSSRDLKTYLARATRPAGCYIVQRQVMGREYTVSNVVGLGGPTLAVVPKEVIAKQGITQIGITRIVPEIDRVCRDIQKLLHADGPFNVQLIMSEEGTPYVIEINPRYSTTVALTIAAGLNEVDVVIRHALGEPVGPTTFRPNLMMVRYAAQLYRLVTDWPPSSVVSQTIEDTARITEGR